MTFICIRSSKRLVYEVKGAFSRTFTTHPHYERSVFTFYTIICIQLHIPQSLTVYVTTPMSEVHFIVCTVFSISNVVVVPQKPPFTNFMS